MKKTLNSISRQTYATLIEEVTQYILISKFIISSAVPVARKMSRQTRTQ